jgi:hypothetical protein
MAVNITFLLSTDILLDVLDSGGDEKGLYNESMFEIESSF